MIVTSNNYDEIVNKINESSTIDDVYINFTGKISTTRIITILDLLKRFNSKLYEVIIDDVDGLDIFTFYDYYNISTLIIRKCVVTLLKIERISAKVVIYNCENIDTVESDVALNSLTIINSDINYLNIAETNILIIEDETFIGEFTREINCKLLYLENSEPDVSMINAEEVIISNSTISNIVNLMANKLTMNNIYFNRTNKIVCPNLETLTLDKCTVNSFDIFSECPKLKLLTVIDMPKITGLYNTSLLHIRASRVNYVELVNLKLIDYICENVAYTNIVNTTIDNSQ